MKNLLQISNLSKAYGPQVILDGASFNMSGKQKIAVVGRNGAGKSTLFNIITGLEKSDSGQVLVFDDTRLGYLKQEDDFQSDDTVLSYLMRKSEKEEWQCLKIAAQFELKGTLVEKKVLELSGGYQMRVKLALMLLFEPNLILLDEPTNYLDLSTILLLEQFLIDYKGSYLIISHDRRFIKRTCNEVLEIDRGKAFHYPGPLEDYLEFKIKKRESEEKFNKKQEAKKKHLQRFIDRFGAKDSKAAQAKSKQKQIDRLEFIDIKNTLSNVIFKIPEPLSTKGFCWRMKSMDIGYGENVVAADIEIDIEKGEHIAVLGDNGQGKSTFMKVLAGQLKPLTGELKPAANLKVGYYAQHVTTEMNPKETVEQYLERSSDHTHTVEEVFKMAGNFLFKDDDIKKPIGVLSGGEKARLALAGLLLNRFDALLLDEPTNHLDFETAEALAFALAESGITILCITHDRTFVSILAERILQVGDKQVKHFYGSFSEYVDSLRPAESIEKVVSAQLNKLKKTKRIEKQAEEKERSKKIKKLENEIEKYKQEKEKLLKRFMDDPTTHNPKRVKRLQLVESKIENLEGEWMEIIENS